MFSKHAYPTVAQIAPLFCGCGRLVDTRKTESDQLTHTHGFDSCPLYGRQQDMANHGFAEPTANFTYDGALEPSVFRLQAMRNMSAGDEVGRVELCICFARMVYTSIQ